MPGPLNALDKLKEIADNAALVCDYERIDRAHARLDYAVKSRQPIDALLRSDIDFLSTIAEGSDVGSESDEDGGLIDRLVTRLKAGLK